MDLEKLPKALQEMKDKVLASVIEEAAPVANAQFVAALTKRIAAQGTGNKPTKAPDKELNQHQKKFLKQAPVVEQRSPVIIQASRQIDKYVITVTGSQAQLAITDTDITNYRKTISEQAKKSLENLL